MSLFAISNETGKVCASTHTTYNLFERGSENDTGKQGIVRANVSLVLSTKTVGGEEWIINGVATKNGDTTTVEGTSFTMTKATWYTMTIEHDGTDIYLTVTLKTPVANDSTGIAKTKITPLVDSAKKGAGYLEFVTANGGLFAIDNICVFNVTAQE